MTTWKVGVRGYNNLNPKWVADIQKEGIVNKAGSAVLDHLEVDDLDLPKFIQLLKLLGRKYILFEVVKNRIAYLLKWCE